MNKVIICIMMLILSISSFSQQATQSLSHDDYLAKSKSQKVLGFIMLGAGATTLIIIRKGNTNLNSVGALAIAGCTATLGSILLFITSAKNKRKANLIIKDEKVLITPKLNTKNIASLGISINL